MISLMYPSLEVSFYCLKMDILPNDFSQLSCLYRHHDLKYPPPVCLVHISPPLCDHLRERWSIYIEFWERRPGSGLDKEQVWEESRVPGCFANDT